MSSGDVGTLAKDLSKNPAMPNAPRHQNPVKSISLLVKFSEKLPRERTPQEEHCFTYPPPQMRVKPLDLPIPLKTC